MVATSFDLSQIKTDSLSSAATFRDLVGLGAGSSATFSQTIINGGTVTASTPVINATQTWNDAAVTFTAMKMDVTDTASASDSLLMDLQVGGTSKFNIQKNGYLLTFGGSPAFIFNGGTRFQFNATNMFRVLNTGGMEWSSGGIGGPYDLKLFRDDAGVLAQRNDTNAQEFRLYNTYTYPGTSYERGFLKWDANVFKIGTEAAGTGTQRYIEIAPGTYGNNRVRIQSHALGCYVGRHDLSGYLDFTSAGTVHVKSNWHDSTNGTGHFQGYAGGLAVWRVTNVGGLELLDTGNETNDQLGGLQFSNTTIGTPTVKLRGNIANTLEQRNGTNAQEFRLYNTYTDASNYERGFLKWDSNVFKIDTEASGTGSNRPLHLGAGGSTSVKLNTNGRVEIGTGTSANSVLSIGGDRLVVLQGGNGVLRSSSGFLTLESGSNQNIVINGSQVRFNGFDGGGSTNFRAKNTAQPTIVIRRLASQNQRLIRVQDDSINEVLAVDYNGDLLLGSNSSGGVDTYSYNYFTSNSDYERGFLKWDANVFKIGTEAAGTGTVRDLHLGRFFAKNYSTSNAIFGLNTANSISVHYGTWGGGTLDFFAEALASVPNDTSMLFSIRYPPGSDGVCIKKTLPLCWGDLSSSPYRNLTLYGDVQYTLSQRRGTNPQAYHIYNTYTDASNYERGFLKWDSNVFNIAVEAAGTGTAREIVIGDSSSSRIRIRHNDDVHFYRYSAERLRFNSSGSSVFGNFIFQDSFVQMTDIATPSTPAANTCRIYAKDNGSGKTQLVVLMPDGIETVLATET